MPTAAHRQCANCSTPLLGHYCYFCGQSTHDYHRSFKHLLWEAVEGFTHLDGRLVQTLPLLLFRPGKLARDHFDGRRARHIPPFRLFLTSVLLLVLVMELTVHVQFGKFANVNGHLVIENQQGQPLQASPTAQQGLKEAANDKDVAVVMASVGVKRFQDRMQQWAAEHLGRASANPEYFTSLLFAWAHRLAILMLPIMALQLAVLYAHRRRFYAYDHFIVSMQFLSFCFLLWTAVALLPNAAAGSFATVLTVWMPINLWQTLRGAYGSGVVGAAFKTACLYLGTMVLFALLVTAMVLLVLNKM